MTVRTLTLTCSSAASAECIAGVLEPLAEAVSYFETDDGMAWTVTAYFGQQPDEALIRQTMTTATGDDTVAASASFEVLADKDWVTESQRLLPPVHAGGFIIHGSHDRETVPHTCNTIEIDAGEAFGTAHHGTTTGCLEAIARLTQQENCAIAPDNILDLGTGSAILAIAAHRQWPSAQILASDIDPVAIAVGERNAALNRAEARIVFVVSDGFCHSAITTRAPFHLIIANILAGPLIGLAGDVCGALAKHEGARVILSGLLEEQTGDVLEAYLARGLSMENQVIRNGWSTLVLKP